MTDKLYRLEISAPEKEYNFILSRIALMCPYGWEEESLTTGETVFRIYADSMQPLNKIKDEFLGIANVECHLATEKKQDWQNAWKEFFTPVLAGKSFAIIPPWLSAQEFLSRKKIIINPTCAFGTGHHASTVLCLEALDTISLRDKNKFLDIGCGSGVLSIAAVKRGLTGVALDIDELAVNNAGENAALNGISFQIEQGSVEKAGDQKFDLIMANILANPLIDMARQIKDALKPNAALILSGILDIQADKVAKAYQECGLEAPERFIKDEWVCLVFKN